MHYGRTVVIAARISALAPGGEILLPRALLASDFGESGALVESCHSQCIRGPEWFNPSP